MVIIIVISDDIVIFPILTDQAPAQEMVEFKELPFTPRYKEIMIEFVHRK